MSTLVSRNVDELSETSRRGIEQLLGVALEANQRVFVLVDELPPTAPAEARLRSIGLIREIMAKAQASADRQGISDAEIDAAIDEAMSDIRRRS